MFGEMLLGAGGGGRLSFRGIRWEVGRLSK